MSFGEESTITDQPNFPPQRFLTKAIQTARMSRQRLTKDKPIGASPRRDEDGTILVCSTYSTYTVRIGTSKRGGTLRGLRIKRVCI